MTEPQRRCVGCGRTAPQRELVRFVVVDGELVPGAGASGRGAYTCRDRTCFDRALARGGFARALRSNVNVDPALVRLYTGESNGERR